MGYNNLIMLVNSGLMVGESYLVNGYLYHLIDSWFLNNSMFSARVLECPGGVPGE